jgi:hypothetical protein
MTLAALRLTVGLPMLQFAIRDVFWLTALAGMALAWAVDHRAQIAVQDEFFDRYVTAMEPLGYEVELGADGQIIVTVPPHAMPDRN